MTEPLLTPGVEQSIQSKGVGKAEKWQPEEPALCRFCCCDCLQWWLLVMICALTFGSYWVFDTPGAIFTQLQDWFGDGYSNSDNLNLYSVYSWPNTVLALFGGFLIDRVTGVRLGCLIFCGLILTGQIVFALGVQFKQYWIAFIGRFIYGLGGENLTVAQNAFTVRWFDGDKLALAFGLVVASSRIGSSVNFVVTPVLANMNDGVPLSVWFGAAMCCVSMAAAITVNVLDWYGEPRIRARQAREEERLKAEGVKPKPAQDDAIKFQDIKKLSLSAWLLNFICLFFYIGVLTFYTVASDIMQNTGNNYSSDTASMFLSIPNFVSIFASPLFGRIVDKKGRALNFLLIASVMMIVAHILFLGLANGWFLTSPIPIMIWLGLGYALGAASLWPTLGCCVEPRMLGTAYGMMTAVQNFGMALFPMTIGFLQDANGIDGTNLQYTLPILIFIGCEGVSFLLTFILIGVDRRQNNGAMNASAEQRALLKAEKEREEEGFSEQPDILWTSGTGDDGNYAELVEKEKVQIQDKEKAEKERADEQEKEKAKDLLSPDQDGLGARKGSRPDMHYLSSSPFLGTTTLSGRSATRDSLLRRLSYAN